MNNTPLCRLLQGSHTQSCDSATLHRVSVHNSSVCCGGKWEVFSDSGGLPGPMYYSAPTGQRLNDTASKLQTIFPTTENSLLLGDQKGATEHLNPESGSLANKWNTVTVTESVKAYTQTRMSQIKQGLLSVGKNHLFHLSLIQNNCRFHAVWQNTFTDYL